MPSSAYTCKMEHVYITTSGTEWSVYLQQGGARLLLAFHGFGQDANFLQAWQDPLLTTHSIAWVELPNHGRSRPSARPVQAAELAELVVQVQSRLPTQGIDVLAYSMGATLAIMLFHADVQQLDRLILLAPNGDHRLRYRFFTRTWLGHALFRRSKQNPALLMRLIKLMHRSGMINAKLMRIIEEEYGSPERIRRVYNTYMAFSHKKWTYSALREIQAQRKSQWHFVFGHYDRVIGPKQSRGLLRHLPHQQHWWESGHLLIQPQHFDKIQVLLSSTKA